MVGGRDGCREGWPEGGMAGGRNGGRWEWLEERMTNEALEATRDDLTTIDKKSSIKTRVSWHVLSSMC